MKLTTSLLAPFIGGQIEVQNGEEGYIYRGEIKTAEVVEENLVVTLAWMAKGEGGGPLPTGWVNEPNLEYTTDLSLCTVSSIGPSAHGGNRYCLSSSLVGEMIVLYPKDGSKLDPAKVKGLSLPTA